MLSRARIDINAIVGWDRGQHPTYWVLFEERYACAERLVRGLPSRHHAMNAFTAALLFSISIPSLSLAQPASAAAPSPRDQHAAQCVAALEVNTEDLARQVKSGQEASRPMLMERLVSGTAFVGDTYLHGGSDEKQARELANRALEAQKSLPAHELTARQTACADEGAKLFASSNGLEQAIVKRLAKKRMDKLLGG
jgi:hypothetical protein